MFNIIERYIMRMTKEDVNNFALKKDVHLSESELDFTYNFIKRNYKEVLGNPKLLDLERYKKHYTEENFRKITKVFQEYSNMYSSYL